MQVAVFTNKFTLADSIGFFAMSAFVASARSISRKVLFLFVLQQFLKKIYQFNNLINFKVSVSRTVAVIFRPQFQVLNSIIRLYSVFVVNSFRGQQMSSQMFFHYNSVFLYITILRSWVIRIVNHYVTFWGCSASTLPFRTCLTFGLRTRNTWKTIPTKTAKSAFSDCISNLSYLYSISFRTLRTFSTDSRNGLFTARNIFKNLRIEIKYLSQIFSYFVKCKWSCAHSVFIIPLTHGQRKRVNR